MVKMFVTDINFTKLSLIKRSRENIEFKLEKSV